MMRAIESDNQLDALLKARLCDFTFILKYCKRAVAIKHF